MEAMRQGKRVIVRACAGSGKTTTLVHAYMEKLKEIEATRKTDDPFDRLLAITFTNEATVKLKRDVFRETNGNIKALTNRTISTIHSFCNSILKENIVEAGINPEYRVVDEYDAVESEATVMRRVAGEGILQDDELRTFVQEYGLVKRGRVSNSGFGGMMHAVYAWIRAGGWSLDEGLEKLGTKRAAFTDWLTQRGREGDETQSYIEKLNRSAALIEKYLERYWRLLEAEKRERGLICYDDIIYYACRLLREHAYIRESYRKRFEYVFVDEFQDTDTLQLDIVNMISDRGRQFFVGDPQQLIYEWRNASPELFAGAEKEALEDTEGSIVVNLRENFRSSDGIVSFVNSLFPVVNAGGAGGYVEMIAAREDLRDDGGDPSVRILVPEGSTRDEMCASEASMIASEISRIVEEGITILDLREGKRRKAKYADIALLFRSRSAVGPYEEKLAAEGVPFIGLQVSDFFDKPEVVALRDYVMHMAGSNDAFYTASVMRSPLFDVDDDSIVSSAACNFDIGKMRELKGGSGDTALARFIQTEEWLHSVRGMRISAVLTELIRKSCFDMLCVAGGSGMDAHANILSFVELVRRCEIEGKTGAADIAAELESMEERKAGPEALLYDESSNAVRLMTVHAAKGLEYPIVFVARAFSRARKNSYDMSIHRDFGIIIGETDAVDSPLRRFHENVVEDLDKLKSGGAEEESRIFYVAATRAQQQLYLSASSSVAGSWSARVWDVLSASGVNAEDAPEGVSGIGKGSILLIRSARHGREPALHARRNIRLDWASLELDMAPGRGSELFAMRPTTLAEYMVCHHRSSFSGTERTERTGAGTGGMERGSTIHDFLENYDYVNHREPAFLKDKFGTDYEEIASRARRFVTSDTGREAGEAAAEGRLYRELQFSARYGRGVLNGKIDMIIRAGNACTIVDYKSGGAHGRMEEYRNQLLIYASAVTRMSACRSFRLMNCFVDEKELFNSFTVDRDGIELFDSAIESAMEAYDREDREASPDADRCASCAYKDACEFSL